MNKAILIGRLTADPELQTTPSGISTVRFCVAVNRRFKNAEGGYDADFLYCIAWRQQAEFICKYFKKGSSIGVSGAIQTSSWEGTDGKRQYKTEIVVEEVAFCEKANQSGQAQSYASQVQQSTQQTVNDPLDDLNNMGFVEQLDENEDDLPF